MTVELPDPAAMAERLRDAMAIRGITSPAELARRVNVPRQTVTRWMHRMPNKMELSAFLRLLLVLNVSGYWLVNGGDRLQRAQLVTPDESHLLDLYRAASSHQRDAFLSLLSTMTRVTDPPEDIG